MMILHNKQQEEEIQKTLINHIDSFCSFRFNAGAGAGKTYALVECLKYLQRNKLFKLQKNNQKIVCITYTNVAVEEIKERLGNSDIIIVSTIHEMLWKIIQFHQPQLVKLHRAKIQLELDRLEKELSDKNHEKLKVFTNLKEKEKNEFRDFVFNTEDVYYQNINAKAAQFKAAYEPYKNKSGSENLTILLKNSSNYKEIVKRIYKQKRYQRCIENIDIKDPKYQRAEYDNTVNTDRLHKMKFSHDTLLEYSSSLIEKYPILRRVVIDQYPYFFIDEYQDTQDYVVKLIQKINIYSIEQNKEWLIGYFGDTAQNIYNDGVGAQINRLHPNLTNVDKVFNRRSHCQIIDVINKIRSDNIKQISIDTEKNKGDIKFYYTHICKDETSKINYAYNFLDIYKEQLCKDEFIDNKKIHCLVLTNNLMAKLNGFSDIYHAFKSAENIYYTDLNTKLLSHELEKLDPSIRVIYQLIKLFMLTNNNRATYYDIFGSKSKNISFKSANDLITYVRNIKPETLGDLISNISNYYHSNKKNEALEIYIEIFLKKKKNEIIKYINIENMIQNLLRNLMVVVSDFALSDDEMNKFSDEEVAKVQNVLNIPISIWEKWVNYIDKKFDEEIIFHTYHGTKGEEYENVAIIMEHSFGKNYIGRDKFKKYFQHLQLTHEEQKEILTNEKYAKEFCNTQNLMYVACSRAIRNLKILYLDDTTEIKDGIESIFGKIQEFELIEKNM